MRNNKNIITLSLENIISFFRNITSHFTGKAKIITLVLIIIMLSFVNITLCFSNIFSVPNVSALSYSDNVGISFTFNPALSVNISSSDLVIPNLTPGAASDSNTINVSVATNAAYGYTLSAIMNGNNSNLTHTNVTNVFSSIDTDANLSSLTTDNTWGYSYKLSNDTNWNNYSGLSNETSKTLVDSNDQTAIPIDFKIAAKAASTQASGTYTGVINFTAVSNVAPMSLLDSFIASGAEQLNGYYKMQDMTHSICSNVDIEESELQLIDVRDNKIYWVAKLKDGNCWMTQNLDLDINDTKTYTHYDTDLGWTTNDESATWKPTEGHSTINFTGSTVDGWVSSDTEPYSANPGDKYIYTSNSTANDITYDSLQGCINANHNDCTHYHIGNYYNWASAISTNNIPDNLPDNTKMNDSICPSNWRLPIANSSGIREFGYLLYKYDIIESTASRTFTDTGLQNIRLSPLYIVRYGRVGLSAGSYALYWTNQSWGSNRALSLYFNNPSIIPFDSNGRGIGGSVRCLAR